MTLCVCVSVCVYGCICLSHPKTYVTSPQKWNP